MPTSRASVSMWCLQFALWASVLLPFAQVQVFVLASAPLTHHEPGFFSGEGTQYTLGEPHNGNCNLMSYPKRAETMYAALNAEQFAKTRNCGRCAKVRCVDALCPRGEDSSEIVYLVDQCPECVRGDLDLSPAAFKSITGFSSSRVAIEWEFVDCPLEGNVEYCLKSGSNPFWTAIQPTNVVAGVQSLQVNGQETTMVDSAYYFLLNGDSKTQTDLSALTITLTSVSGEVLTETVSLLDGGCVAGTQQFARGSPVSAADFDPTETATKTPSPKEEAGVIAVPDVTDTEAETPSPSDAATTTTPSPEPKATTTPTPSTTKTPLLRTAGYGSQEDAGDTAVNHVGKNDEDADTVAANTRGEDGGLATSPALIALIVLGGVAVIVLVVLAVRVKRRRREEKEVDAIYRNVSHVSDLPPLVVRQRSYEELITPSKSQRADIAIL